MTARRERIVKALWAVDAVVLVLLCVLGVLGYAATQNAATAPETASMEVEKEAEAPRLIITVTEIRPAQAEDSTQDVPDEDPDEDAKILAAILEKCQVVENCYIVGYAPELIEGWRPEWRSETGMYLTASGMWCAPGTCVATDPDVIPTGSTVIIDGQVYVAADRGVTGRVVDVMVTPEEAMAYGCRRADVYWCMEGD